MNFEAFYRANYRRIYAAALTMAGDPEIALDVTQEAFVRAFARWRRLSKEPWVEGWVMSTAMNLSKRQLRRQRREVTSNELGVRVVSSESGTGEGDRLHLLSVLLTLPRRQREAVMLHYLADLSHSRGCASQEHQRKHSQISFVTSPRHITDTTGG